MDGTLKVSVTTPSDREIRIEREFSALRTRVFEAMTRPELVRQWLLGPPGWTMPVCEIDFRPGGAFRSKHADAEEMGMRGTSREITGRTTMTITARYASREARDGALRSGMESGLESSYNLLDGLLEEAP